MDRQPNPSPHPRVLRLQRADQPLRDGDLRRRIRWRRHQTLVSHRSRSAVQQLPRLEQARPLLRDHVCRLHLLLSGQSTGSSQERRVERFLVNFDYFYS